LKSVPICLLCSLSVFAQLSRAQSGAASMPEANPGSRPAVLIGCVRRVHTSVAPELDVGTFRKSASIFLSEDLHGFHFGTNGIFAEQVQGALRRAQFGQTRSISHSLGKFTIFGESKAFLAAIREGQTPSVISGRFPVPFARMW